jgi:hypothetical protein
MPDGYTTYGREARFPLSVWIGDRASKRGPRAYLPAMSPVYKPPPHRYLRGVERPNYRSNSVLLI